MMTYIRCLQDHREPWILKVGQVHRSLKFPSDSGDSVRDPLEAVGHFFDLGFGGTDDERVADGVKLDSG